MALGLALVLAIVLAVLGLAGMVVAAVVLIRQARARDAEARRTTPPAPGAPREG